MPEHTWVRSKRIRYRLSQSSKCDVYWSLKCEIKLKTCKIIVKPEHPGFEKTAINNMTFPSLAHGILQVQRPVRRPVPTSTQTFRVLDQIKLIRVAFTSFMDSKQVNGQLTLDSKLFDSRGRTTGPNNVTVYCCFEFGSRFRNHS